MSLRALLPVLLLFWCLPGFSQSLSYTVRFPNVAHHEARVELLATGINGGSAIFRMSRASPGRYATHEFGKNVYDVTAADGTDKALPVQRLEGDVYQVSGITNGTARLSYTLYGNYADGTYSAIDARSIHLNMPSAFMWVKGMEQAPIRISFDLPDTSLTIATQLRPGPDAHTFTAPGLQYFMDSPVKIGKLQWRSWQVSQDGRDLQFRLAVEADTNAAGVDWLAGKVKLLAEQARAVYGVYPPYDNGTYTFLASLNPYVHGDGMEHRNSTMITVPYFPGPHNLSVFAHEYFHGWNVERIRPRSLEPFSFEHSNMSGELWCAEGFTTYYGVLLPVRAGLETPSGYAPTLARLANAKLNTPGGTLYTPVHASQMAVFTDAGVSVDKTNYPNMFTSYYPYGAALGLALDLMLRSKYHTSLDGYMQRLWLDYGKTETPYTLADLQAALAKISDAAFAGNFFRQYIYGHEAPDYAALLALAGYELRRASPGKAWIGDISLTATGEGLVIDENTVRNTPVYEAGLDVDDAIISVDNRPVADEAAFRKIIASHQPGERLVLTFRHRGKVRFTAVTLSEDPAYKVVLFEEAGRPVTAAMSRFRQEWLGAQAAPQKR